MKCSIIGCEKQARRRGWCPKHYSRWLKYGDPDYTTCFQREAVDKFFEDALVYRGDECLFWPFNRTSKGYGRIYGDKKSFYVHRMICERVYGPHPKDRRFVAHSCGNGHLGCVTPRHLRWAKSPRKWKGHGPSWSLIAGYEGAYSKTDGVLYIFNRIRGGGDLQELADEFGVWRSTINNIKTGRTWSWLTGQGNEPGRRTAR